MSKTDIPVYDKEWRINPDLREILCRLLHQNVNVLTPAGTITGTLIRVKVDYVVVVESTANLVLLPFDKIESITAA